MFYHSHVTKKEERDEIVKGDFVWKSVDPQQVVAIDPPPKGGLTLGNLRPKSIVWYEDKNEYSELYFRFMYEVLDELKAGRSGLYMKLMAGSTDITSLHTREKRIAQVFNNMKTNGFQAEEGHWGGVCVDETGERLDGSYRSSIASYLGIKEIRVKEFKRDWRTVTEDFLKRKLKADLMQNGLDYYAIDFGPFKNYEKAHGNHFGNVEKWDFIKGLVDWKGKKVLDLGCNAGYHSIQMALAGASVTGVDFTLTGTANLYRLIYEYLNKKNIDVKFEDKDVRDAAGEYDIVVCLNTHYHVPDQLAFMKHVKTLAPVVILQGNLNKVGEYDHVDIQGMNVLLVNAGYKTIDNFPYKDKPIVIGYA